MVDRESKVITVTFDSDGIMRISQGSELTERQLKAIKEIREWFIIKDVQYTFKPNGWINEVVQ